MPTLHISTGLQQTSKLQPDPFYSELGMATFQSFECKGHHRLAVFEMDPLVLASFAYPAHWPHTARELQPIVGGSPSQAQCATLAAWGVAVPLRQLPMGHSNYLVRLKGAPVG